MRAASFGWGLCLVVCAMWTVAHTAGATVIPSEKEHVISLDGTWRFKLEQAGGKDAAPVVIPMERQRRRDLGVATRRYSEIPRRQASSG